MWGPDSARLVLVFAWTTALVVGAARSEAANLSYGEYLASECVTCHQLSGASAGIPPITGMELGAFVAAFTAYKTRTRENVTMQTLASRYTAEDILALGTYFASIKPHKE